MDFGTILEKWERKAKPLAYDKEDSISGASPRGERRYRLLRKKPDDYIDLHGLMRDEAWTALETFFENSRRKGYEKVLIVHGKGNHGNEGALRDLSRSFIESCTFAGESGYSSAKEGGTGATWVILKEADS